MKRNSNSVNNSLIPVQTKVEASKATLDLILPEPEFLSEFDEFTELNVALLLSESEFTEFEDLQNLKSSHPGRI